MPFGDGRVEGPFENEEVPVVEPSENVPSEVEELVEQSVDEEPPGLEQYGAAQYHHHHLMPHLVAVGEVG